MWGRKISYRGNVIEIPCGFDGLTGSKNHAQISPTQLIQALNITYEAGTVGKEGGSTKYNAVAITGAPTILGGHDWFPSDGVQRMVIVTSAGNIHRDAGAGTFPVTLKTGLTTTNIVPMFVEGGKEAAAQVRKLFIFTGLNPVQVLDADDNATGDLAVPPTDWTSSNQPVSGCIHENRLCGWGNLNDPHRVYMSLPSNHEDFTSAGALNFAIYPGEGERLIAGMSYKGALVLWKKPRGVYLIDTSPGDTDLWRVIRLSDSIGIASPQSAVVVDDDILYMDTNGNFQFLSATSNFGDLTSRNLSTAVQMNEFFKHNVNFVRMFNVRAIYYPTKREAHFAIAGIGQTPNTHRVVVDFNRLDIPRFRWSDKDTCQSLWLRKDADLIPRPMSGDDAGFVWRLDQETRAKDGGSYNGLFQTPQDDFSRIDAKLASRRKLGDFLEMIGEPVGNYDVNVEVQWDGNTRQIVSFNQGAGQSSLGVDTILGSWILGGGELLVRRKRITGSGRRFSLVVRNNGAGEDFSISKFLLYFRVGDERMGA